MEDDEFIIGHVLVDFINSKDCKNTRIVDVKIPIIDLVTVLKNKDMIDNYVKEQFSRYWKDCTIVEIGSWTNGPFVPKEVDTKMVDGHVSVECMGLEGTFRNRTVIINVDVNTQAYNLYNNLTYNYKHLEEFVRSTIEQKFPKRFKIIKMQRWTLGKPEKKGDSIHNITNISLI
jgi:hypothetical protein